MSGDGSENSSEEIKMLRVDYRRINPKCARCPAAPVVIRIEQGTDGEVYVSTWCEEHAREDQQRTADKGLTNISGTGTFINYALYERMLESGGIGALQEAIEHAMDDDDDKFGTKLMKGPDAQPDHGCVECGKVDSETMNGMDLCLDCTPDDEKN